MPEMPELVHAFQRLAEIGSWLPTIGLSCVVIIVVWLVAFGLLGQIGRPR